MLALVFTACASACASPARAPACPAILSFVRSEPSRRRPPRLHSCIRGGRATAAAQRAYELRLGREPRYPARPEKAVRVAPPQLRARALLRAGAEEGGGGTPADLSEAEIPQGVKVEIGLQWPRRPLD